MVSVSQSVVDDRRGVIKWSGAMTPTGTMFSASTSTVSAALAMTGLKLRAVKSMQIADVVGRKTDTGQVGAQRGLEQERLPSTSMRCFALFQPRCRRRWA